MSEPDPPGPSVLIVTASASRRGAEIQASQLAEQLDAADNPVRIVALHRGDRPNALPLEVLGTRRLGVRTLWKLRRAARTADVVLAYGSSTLPACALALIGSGRPFIYRSISTPARWLRGRWHRRLTGGQFRRAAHVVALWPGAAASVTSLFGVPADRCAVIPNARDPGVFRPPTSSERRDARASFGLDVEPTVLFAGTLGPEKRVDRAIDAVAQTREHTLLIAGTGPGLAAARTQAETSAPERIRFLGELDDIRSALWAADVVLITSDIEGMPGVAIEAALCGTAVVATDAGALRELPFVTISSPEPDALAAAIEQAEPARPGSADPYTWPAVTTQWLALLQRVVAEDRCARRLATRRSQTRSI